MSSINKQEALQKISNAVCRTCRFYTVGNTQFLHGSKEYTYIMDSSAWFVSLSDRRNKLKVCNTNMV